MLVSTKVVNDLGTPLAVNHIGVESADPTRVKRAQPRHGLAAEGVTVSVVLDREGDLFALFREHDPAPRSDHKKWERIKWTMPDLIHDAPTNGSDLVFTAESKSLLNLRM